MSGDQLKKVEALLDPCTPDPTRTDVLPQLITGLQALLTAEEAIDKAKAPTGEKAFKSLQAHVAMAGMQLMRTDARDGPVRIFAVSGSKVLEMRTVDDIEGLLNYLRER